VRFDHVARLIEDRQPICDFNSAAIRGHYYRHHHRGRSYLHRRWAAGVYGRPADYRYLVSSLTLEPTASRRIHKREAQHRVTGCENFA
jgi:hypothetical protein